MQRVTGGYYPALHSWGVPRAACGAGNLRSQSRSISGSYGFANTSENPCALASAGSFVVTIRGMSVPNAPAMASALRRPVYASSRDRSAMMAITSLERAPSWVIAAAGDLTATHSNPQSSTSIASAGATRLSSSIRTTSGRVIFGATVAKLFSKYCPSS